MQPLLYLVHRIPYPPDKGDKIRSYHLLKHLLNNYRVYLGAFIDNEADWAHQRTLSQLCEDVFLQRLTPRAATLRSVTGLFTGQALSLPYYFSKPMQNWVNNTIKSHDIRKVVVFSSAMAQYTDRGANGEGGLSGDITRIIDFVDVDSDKWRQYSEHKIWPLSWLYKREGKKLLQYETSVSEMSSASLFVSKEEADHFQTLVGKRGKNVDYFYNGVDTGYFSPDQGFANPYHDNEKAIVFTGAMDYWANVDAVSWYAKEVFPLLYKEDNNIRFYIVGSNPSPAVTALAKGNAVVVTGRVADVRPYLAHACFAVAPMRIARGIQNKVLEAMAMGCTVLLTSAGAEGIAAESGSEFLVADSAKQMLDTTKNILSGTLGSGMGKKARQFVIDKFNWETNLSRIDRWLVE